MYGVRTMEEVFDQRATKTLGILTEAIGGMGLLGLILAMVGLYGLMSVFGEPAVAGDRHPHGDRRGPLRRCWA